MDPKPLTTVRQKKILWGLATVYKLRDDSTRFQFSVGRIAATLVGTLILGWITLFSAAYFHFKYRRGYEEASYLETLMFPITHEKFQKKRGEYYIQSAFTAIEDQDYLRALNLLRNGLLRSPENLKARRTLSEFYEFLFNRPNLAFDLLADGIPFLADQPAEQQADYIQYLFMLGSRNQLDSKLIEAGITLKAELSDTLPESLSALINYQIASGYRNIGDKNRAEEIIEQQKLDRFSEGLVLQAQLLWDKGLEDLAIQLLKNKVSSYRDNPAIYSKLISLLEEKQQIDSARRYCILYQLEHPTQYPSHVARLQHYYKYNRSDTESIEHFIQEFLTTFSSDQIAIRQLAILTSKFGDVEHTRDTLARFDKLALSENGQLLADFILIEAMVRNRQYDRAITEIDRIENESKHVPINPDSTSILLSLKIAAYHGKGNMSEVTQALNKLKESPVIKIDRYLAVSYLFLEVDAPDIALEIMDHCLQTQEYTANIREALIAIYLKSGDVEKLSEVLMEAIDKRRLPNLLLIDSYRLISSDNNLHIRERSKVMEKIQSCFSTDYLFKAPKS